MHTLYELVCKNFLEGHILPYLKSSYVVEKDAAGVNRRVYKNEILDSRILLCQALCPDEFQRKLSTTAWQKKWKATEYRQFWLYLAYGLMEDLLDSKLLKLVA